MPASESSKKDSEPPHDDVREGDRDRDREKDKNGKTKGSAKTKDLSHVPCKFFKIGSCTAGSSCPFSHAVLEPGQQKEVCAWFVKGNCKFGHKCALAHILPGQSMSMDRKNKKAAQLAANPANSGGNSNREGAGKGGGRSGKNASHTGGSGGSQSRNPLLSGSTAPTRAISNSSRSAIPMPLKATLSPSTPAPPVQDTDFASFGLPDESNKLPSAPAQGKLARSPATAETPPAAHDGAPANATKAEAQMRSAGAVPLPLPMSTPRRTGDAQHGSPAGVDFGPIGSPPRSSPSTGHPARINGFSPGTSPQAPGLSTSPFSAPGTQSVFAINAKDDSIGFTARSGLSASLGAMMTWTADRSTHVPGPGIASEVVVEDEDLEEFLPSSLTDLLTPEERSRRLSRTNGARPNLVSPEREAGLGQRPAGDGYHKYSHSVPAPSLLQDIRSIWADSGDANVAGGDASVVGGGLGNGTPNSFSSNSGLHGRHAEDMISPSNASAAFLPGLHHHYLNAKGQRSNLLSGISSLTSTGHNVSHNIYANAHGSAGALSPPRTGMIGNRTGLDSTTSDAYYSHTSRHIGGRPIPGRDDDGLLPDADDRRNALSPSARALQAHAPGQSLPQGLAAGYSRIHALPPPPTIASPSTPGAFSQTGGFSPGTKMFGHHHSSSGDWHSMSPNAGNAPDHMSMSPNLTMQASSMTSSTLGGLETVFSRLSYSAATARGGAAPIGVGSRIPSGRGNPQGSLSPLSGPVLMGDDDDLFSMDG